ncbi:hypothetical protein OI25_3406 [Paraburkholderia fungorum]|uniref:Uncharacterized protein n=1 Tax=Paraburkholderia fungorum TaxID=134537 RepID=A0AAU8T457_9BURK|nr:hypothetical protein [Paraburkholderia fungorum]AJZ61095.1 hypothetical protein OI25_3406 [Paraburkholderia fungorum]
MAMSEQKRSALTRIQQAQSRAADEHDAWRLALQSHGVFIQSCLNAGMNYNSASRQFAEINRDHQERYSKALEEMFEAEKAYRETP